MPTSTEAPAIELLPPPPDVTSNMVAVPEEEDAAEALAANGIELLPPPPDIVTDHVVASEPEDAAEALADAELVRQLSLSAKEPDYREEFGDEAEPEHEPLDAGPATPLDNAAIYRIIREVALADSGDDLYSAVSTDDAAQFGLCFGLVLFPQASSHLGSALRLMQTRNAAAFAETFGPAAVELLAVTNAAAPEARLQPVAGEPLTSDTWVDRFRRSGAVPEFQAAQNEEAIEHQFRPMLRVALDFGFATDRALAMVYDRVVTRGLGGGLRWVVETAGPLRTAAQRSAALELLGAADVAAFEATAGMTRRDGQFDLETHAALVAALRRQGKIPLPSATDLQCRLVAAATGAAKERLAALLESDAFSDTISSAT
ncbi:MAG TPA: hypothetical protein VE596_17060 [Gaiellaceae bacterium]|nr:hypothetical protein [Gaiellaceae bacterium]